MSFVDIYIESYAAQRDVGIVDYTIDFKSEKDLSAFLEVFEIEISSSDPKFYGLTLPYQGRKIMYAGSWYRFPLIKYEAEDVQIIEISPDKEDEGGAFYRNKFQIKRQIESFTELLTKVESLDSKYDETINVDPMGLAHELVVVDCGQGNWNEIKTNSDTVIYDLGASSRYSETQIRKLIDRRFKNFSEKSVYIIISHWDMDHFQSLKYLSKDNFSKVKAVYGPTNIPSTLVYQKAIDNILNNKVPFKLIPNTERIGRTIDLNLLISSHSIDLYRATNGRSRNQTGIVLAVKGAEKLALLTGDHHYCKILVAILGKYSNKKTVLVAPHHGGAAGHFSVHDWSNELSVEDCAISVGDNSYNHPNPHYNNLKFLKNGIPNVTDGNGDLTYQI
ncbi:hypothetical protein ACP43V_14290 [Vibrio genomosp. F10 str. 9ZC157]|uniref:Metallo-beta-lactamase domain-containing protein n=1 Tax=Vibrio genomosp. F10 str. ZF-129 TaxID=1187848 RepID=A0A1E5BH56_9VIBR|nr:hypothetical protein [Vibrio genomosp. F10]OEE36043.1 hypothetical protein A1QO_05450 [Vibrio genomosp. F10 str. ZF-129]OEE93923.1 hypothetical protein A1QM_07890 [Vibrio genomosp. F10 str. 9ZC157]